MFRTSEKPPVKEKKGSYSFWGVFHIRGQDNFHQYSQYISLHPLDFQLSNPSGALGISAIVKAVEHLPARFVPFTGRRMWQIHLLRDRPMVMAQDRATLVNIKIAGKCIFIHQKKIVQICMFQVEMIPGIIAVDPCPYRKCPGSKLCMQTFVRFIAVSFSGSKRFRLGTRSACSCLSVLLSHSKGFVFCFLCFPWLRQVELHSGNARGCCQFVCLASSYSKNASPTIAQGSLCSVAVAPCHRHGNVQLCSTSHFGHS